jgi:hypothetical protein
MPELQPTHAVVLRAGLPPREFEFFKLFAGRLEKENESEELLYFVCTRVNTGGAYLEIDTYKPPETDVFTLQIPHHYVLLISTGNEDRPPFGFGHL